MPSVAEITHFKASEKYRSGDVNLDEPLALLSKAPGLIRSYVGYETEDRTVVYWVNDWITKDARDAFAKQPGYAKIVDASRPAYGSELTVNYVEFENTKGPLGAPITEFVTFTLKEGRAVTELTPLVDELHSKLPGTRQFHGDSWALVIGNPRVYHGLLGWDSVEAHWDAVSGGPLKEVIDRVRVVADLWLKHAKLDKRTAGHDVRE